MRDAIEIIKQIEDIYEDMRRRSACTRLNDRLLFEAGSYLKALHTSISNYEVTLKKELETARKLLEDLGFRAEYNTENDLMRELLRKIDRHARDCNISGQYVYLKRECTCGLEAICDMKNTFEKALKDPCSFLPTCTRQYEKGNVIKCGKKDSEHYRKPCSKRCDVLSKDKI